MASESTARAQVRLVIPRQSWLAIKAEARAQRLPAAVLGGLVLRNYVKRPWPLELIPEKRDPKGEE